MPISSPKADTAQAILEQMRKRIVQRLLTTTEDNSGPPRKDMMVLSFGGSELEKKHHLDTIHLIVTSGLSPQRFHSVVEERLSGDDGRYESFSVSAYEEGSTPLEVKLLSMVLVRLWYLRSPSIQSMLASLLSGSR